MTRVLGIIPAREGSKRVPTKNFRPFGGTTLVDLAIQQGLGAKTITRLLLSSDSDEVLSIGSKYRGILALRRPTEFASDTSPAIEYVLHALDWMKKEHQEEFDAVAILQPSSPFRSSADIDATAQLLFEHPEVDSAVSVVMVDHMVHPLKLKTMQGQELLPWLEAENGRLSAHELPVIYVRNCAVYCTWTHNLGNRTDVIGKRSVGYLMPPETSIDINSMLDFEFAEYLYQKQNA